MMLAVNDFSYIIHAKKKNLGQLNLKFFLLLLFHILVVEGVWNKDSQFSKNE